MFRLYNEYAYHINTGLNQHIVIVTCSFIFTYDTCVEINKVCAASNGRQELETIVYTVTQRENIYSQPVLEPEYGNVLAAYTSPLDKDCSQKRIIHCADRATHDFEGHGPKKHICFSFWFEQNCECFLYCLSENRVPFLTF